MGIAMGCEALLGGLGRIGLAAFTYALLGASVVRWRHLRDKPRLLWTCVFMLALLIPAALDALGFGPFAPEIAHVAHATGLLIGIRTTQFSAFVMQKSKVLHQIGKPANTAPSMMQKSDARFRM